MARVRTRRPPQSKPPETASTEDFVTLLAALFFVLLPLVFTTAGLDTFRLPKAAFALAAISWILAAFLICRRLRFVAGWISGWSGLLLAGLLYVTLHSLVVGDWASSGYGVFVLWLFAGLLVALRETADLERQKILWWALLASLSINAMLAILQYHRLLGEWGTDVGRTLGARFTPAGLIGNVNTGGFLFAVGALMLTALLVASASRKARVAAGGLLLVHVAALAHTRTITAVVVALLCGAGALAFHHWWLRRYSPTPVARPRLVRLWVVAAVGAAVGLLLLSLTGTTARIGRTVEHLQSGNYQRFASGRIPLFETTWGMIREVPLAGRGLNHFGREFFYFKVDAEAAQAVRLTGHQGSFREAHNEYLQTWVELGLPGLILLLALAFWPLAKVPGRIRSEENPATAAWIAFLALSWIAVLVTSLTFFPFHLALTAAVCVLILSSLLHFLEPSPVSEPRRELAASLRRPRFALLTAVVVLAAATITWHQANRWRANTELSIAAGILEEAAAGRIPADRLPTFVSEARRRIEKAEAWDPGNFESRPLQGTAAFLAGRPDQAVAAYQEAGRLLPSPEILTNLAAAHLARGDLVEARRAVETALRYNPRYARAVQALQLVEAREVSN